MTPDSDDPGLIAQMTLGFMMSPVGFPHEEISRGLYGRSQTTSRTQEDSGSSIIAGKPAWTDPRPARQTVLNRWRQPSVQQREPTPRPGRQGFDLHERRSPQKAGRQKSASDAQVNRVGAARGRRRTPCRRAAARSWTACRGRWPGRASPPSPRCSAARCASSPRRTPGTRTPRPCSASRPCPHQGRSLRRTPAPQTLQAGVPGLRRLHLGWIAQLRAVCLSHAKTDAQRPWAGPRTASTVVSGCRKRKFISPFSFIFSHFLSSFSAASDRLCRSAAVPQPTCWTPRSHNQAGYEGLIDLAPQPGHCQMPLVWTSPQAQSVRHGVHVCSQPYDWVHRPV